jgi:hypothetical protein
MVHEYCGICQSRIKKKKGYKVQDVQMIDKINARHLISDLRKKIPDLETAKLGDSIHKSCHTKINYQFTKTKNPQNSETEIDEFHNQTLQYDNEIHEIEPSEDSSCSTQSEKITTTSVSIEITQKIEMKLNKGYSSHKKCFVCKASDKKMVVIHSQSRYDIFAKVKIFIVKGSRICADHLDEKGFINANCLGLKEPINEVVIFDEESIKELIDNFQSIKTSSQLMNQFSQSSPIEENTLQLISLNKDEFLYLVEYIKGKLNDSNKRTTEQALFVYLLWLKNGMTMEV